jgi:hypothetical protein
MKNEQIKEELELILNKYLALGKALEEFSNKLLPQEDQGEPTDLPILRPNNQIGFFPDFHYTVSTISDISLEKVAFLPESKEEFDAIYNSSDTQVLTSKTKSWKEVDWTKTNFIFNPGDYTKLGPLKLQNLAGKKFIAFQEKHIGLFNTPACHLTDKGGEVRIEAFQLKNCSNLLIQNFNIRGKGKTKKEVTGGHINVFEDCNNCTIIGVNIERVMGAAAVRVVGSGNKFWRCTVRNSAKEASGDTGGIGFWAKDGTISKDNEVRDCEFYDITDSVGVPFDSVGLRGLVENTVFINNDFYISEDYRETTEAGEQFAFAEDGADFKNGSKRSEVDAKNYFLFNRVHGMRPSNPQGGTGSSGNCITFHRNACNWVVYGNIFENATMGVSVDYQLSEKKKHYVYGEESGRILIMNNLFSEIQKYGFENHPKGANLGSALRLGPDTDVIMNTFVDCDKFLTSINNKGNHLFKYNLLISIENIGDISELDSTNKFRNLDDYDSSNTWNMWPAFYPITKPKAMEYAVFKEEVEDVKVSTRFGNIGEILTHIENLKNKYDEQD